jgi:hypothetical protein
MQAFSTVVSGIEKLVAPEYNRDTCSTTRGLRPLHTSMSRPDEPKQQRDVKQSYGQIATRTMVTPFWTLHRRLSQGAHWVTENDGNGSSQRQRLATRGTATACARRHLVFQIPSIGVAE